MNVIPAILAVFFVVAVNVSTVVVMQKTDLAQKSTMDDSIVVRVDSGRPRQVVCRIFFYTLS